MSKYIPAYPTPVGVSVRIVNYKALDGLVLEALLFESKSSKSSETGLVFCHGVRGSSLDPVLTGAGQLLAKRGYTVLSINKRNSSALYEQSIFEDTAKDIGGAIANIHSKGLENVILIAHSLGCTEALYYVANSKDASVQAIVLLGPPSDIKGRNTLSFFKRFENPATAYQEFLSRTNDAIAAGRPDDLFDLLIDLPGVKYHLATSAKTFASYRSPQSNCSAIAWIGKIKIPILIVGHGNDWVEDDEYEELMRAANPINKPDFKVIANADHSFDDHYEELAQLIHIWLEEKRSKRS